MKKILFSILLLITFTIPAFCQSPFSYAYRVRPLAALPAFCNPLNGDVVMLTAGAGISPGVYNCTATNTWRPIGFQGNQFNIAQGTLTAVLPGLNITSTWNNAAVVFTGIKENITNTASAANSLLMDLQVGGASMFSVDKGGIVSISTSGNYKVLGRSILFSGADGLWTMSNNAAVDFTRLVFGGNNVAFPAITVSAAVGGQTQGIIITKGDGTTAVFADLGAATNGSMIYCSNCTIASPCAGGGTGSIAKRLNGVWVCN
jgi:hypothetical protein